MESEVWKLIPGFEPYEVSSLGRVRRTGGAPIKAYPKRGYPRVRLSFGATGVRQRNVHQLVAAAFFGPGDGMVVNHINFDRADNRLENLEYVTLAGNVAHAVMGGRHARCERHGMAKLTAEEVRAVRASPAANAEIARRFGIGKRQVIRIRKRERWGALQD